MTISHYTIETTAGQIRLVSFMNLQYTREFNRPGSNNRIGDFIKVRPGVEGRILKITHEFYTGGNGQPYRKTMNFNFIKR